MFGGNCAGLISSNHPGEEKVVMMVGRKGRSSKIVSVRSAVMDPAVGLLGSHKSKVLWARVNVQQCVYGADTRKVD